MKIHQIACALLLGAMTSAGMAAAPVPLRILAINDLHSQLLPPADPLVIVDATQPGGRRAVPTGGVAQLATLVKRLAVQSPNHVLVGAGDLIGNSPFHARLLREESTIAVLSEMGLVASSVGNNEFGGGWREILRLQNGACEEGGCRLLGGFAGARFQYLAANVMEEASGKPMLPSYVVKTFAGIPVAFIGLTRKDSMDRTKVYNFTGIRFEDEVRTINALVPEIRAQGIETIVVLLHEGAKNSAGPNECGEAASLAPTLAKIDKAVDVIVTAHTHQAYNCVLDGRVVTQAASQGRVLTSIDLLLDPTTRDVVSAQASNHLVDTAALPPDPAVQKLLERFEAQAAAEAGRQIAVSTVTLAATANPAGEVPVGLVAADAMLAAVSGADVAFLNPNSLRAALPAGRLAYVDVFEVLPRGRHVATLTLSGAQVVELLAQQWQGRAKPFILQPSAGFSYAWRKDGATASVVPASIRLHGQPLDAQARYRVVLDASLAEGGEGFGVLKDARDRRYVEGFVDYELLARHLSGLGKVEAPADHRIVLGD